MNRVDFLLHNSVQNCFCSMSTCKPLFLSESLRVAAIISLDPKRSLDSLWHLVCENLECEYRMQISDLSDICNDLVIQLTEVSNSSRS